MSAQNRETILDVSGMTCRSCVSHVNAALRELEGIREVHVRLGEGTVIVRHDESAAPVESLIAALTDAGYPARRPTDRTDEPAPRTRPAS